MIRSHPALVHITFSFPSLHVVITNKTLIWTIWSLPVTNVFKKIAVAIACSEYRIIVNQ
jgi:hypothetical protein